MKLLTRVPTKALESLLEDWYWGMRCGEYESVDDCEEIERRIQRAWHRRRTMLGLPPKPEPGSNGETTDLEKPTGTTVPVPLNLGNGDIIAPEVWEEHLGEKIPVRKTTGEIVGWAVVERDPQGGYRWMADLGGER
jgi:hypothetical protein